MSSKEKRDDLNKTLGTLTRALKLVLEEQKLQVGSYNNMSQNYLDLIPIMTQTNQLLLQRQDVEDGLMKFTDGMNIMQGETQRILNENYNLIKSTTGILQSINRLLELNEKKSDEILNLLKFHT